MLEQPYPFVIAGEWPIELPKESKKPPSNSTCHRAKPPLDSTCTAINISVQLHLLRVAGESVVLTEHLRRGAMNCRRHWLRRGSATINGSNTGAAGGAEPDTATARESREVRLCEGTPRAELSPARPLHSTRSPSYLGT